MSRLSYVELKFVYAHSPAEMLKTLIEKGWNYDCEGFVQFLKADDTDDLDWQCTKTSEFNLSNFLSSHSYDQPIRIFLHHKRITGNFDISSSNISVGVNVHTDYLDESLNNINWNAYLSPLQQALQGFETNRLIINQFW